MDPIENYKRNKTFVYNNRLNIYTNTTSVIQEQPSLSVVNAACNYTNDFVTNENVHATAPMTPLQLMDILT